MTLVKNMINGIIKEEKGEKEGGDDYTCLQDIGSSTTFRILGDHWIRNVEDRLILLDNFPQLAELAVTYKGINASEERRDRTIQSVERSNLVTYSNLKKISFDRYYAWPNNKNLAILMNKFPGLIELELDLLEAKPCKEAVQPPVFKAFFA